MKSDYSLDVPESRYQQINQLHEGLYNPIHYVVTKTPEPSSMRSIHLPTSCVAVSSFAV